MSDWMASMVGMSAQAAVLVALILLVRRVAGQRLHPSVMYALWFLVIARLVVPANFESAWSLPVEQSGERGVTMITGVLALAKDGREPAADRVVTPDVVLPAGGIGTEWPMVVWLSGAVLVLALLWRNARNVGALLREARAVEDEAVLGCLADCCRVAGVRRRPDLRMTDQLSTPALVGVWRPVVLLPQNILEQANPDELRYVFLHELVHHRRGDLRWNLLTSLLLAAHWFNPLLWYGFHCMRRDCETSCDAEVLRLAQGSESVPGYGRALLRLAELRLAADSKSFPMAIGIMETQTSTKRRITMITRYRKRAWRDMGWGACIVGLLCVAGFTQAEEKLKPFEVVTESGAVINALDYAKPDPAGISADGASPVSGEKPFTLMVHEERGELVYTFDETSKELATITAKAGVTFTSEGTTLTGELFNLDLATSTIIASGEPVRFSIPQMGDVEGKELEWDVKAQLVKMDGGVKLHQRVGSQPGNLTITSGDSVEIDLKTRQLKVRKNP